METTKAIEEEHIPIMKKGQLNVYKPSNIKRWGVERFLEATEVKEPFLLEFPVFSEEENRVMDELLAEGNQNVDINTPAVVSAHSFSPEGGRGAV